MKDKLEKGDVALFDWDNKKLIKFSYNTKNPLVVQTTNSEMIRRLIVTMGNFNKNSSEQSSKIFWLTIAMVLVGFAQVLFLIYSIFA